MRKLAIAAGLAALVLATPALADGRGGSSPPGRSSPSFGYGALFHQLAKDRGILAFFSQPGSSSHGRHFGWFRGRHWGWFKPHNPHWPHEPPMSP